MKISTYLMTAVLVFFLVGQAHAGPISVELVDFGIMTSKKLETVESKEGVYGKKNLVTDFSVQGTTDRIPAKKGISFGLIYTIKGIDPKTPVDIEDIIVTPGLTDPETGKFYKNDRVVHTLTDADNADPQLSSYSLGMDWELVPGVWTFQLFHNGDKILEKTFTVYKP